MINVKQLLEVGYNSITVREKGDYVTITPTFFHIENDESIALRFSETEDDRTLVTDMGTTKDYLEIMNININKYQDKLNTIKERFYLTEQDGVFMMAIPSKDLLTINKYLGYFIQAISLIANIDL